MWNRITCFLDGRLLPREKCSLSTAYAAALIWAYDLKKYDIKSILERNDQLKPFIKTKNMIVTLLL